MANLKRLKHLRRMIKNVPAKNIAWGVWITEWDEDDWTKCIMCPGSWIATDVFLNNGHFKVSEDGLLATDGSSTWDALEDFFNISEDDTESLFYPGDSSPKDVKKHKEAFLTVLDGIIEKYSDTD